MEREIDKKFYSMGQEEKKVLKEKLLQINEFVKQQIDALDIEESRTFRFDYEFGEQYRNFYSGKWNYHCCFCVERRGKRKTETFGRTGGLKITLEDRPTEYQESYAWSWTYGLELLTEWQRCKRLFLSKIEEFKNAMSFVNSFEI